MRALHLSGTELTLLDRPFVPRPDEERVRVTLAGVCATDIELQRGYMGFSGVPGHEFVGVIEGGARDGERVVGEINCPCGTCACCRRGRGNHCGTRTVLGILGRDGAFAEYLSLPTANLHRVPDGVPDASAVFVEPLAAACRILEQVHIGPGTTVIVLGLGRLGQLCARVLALTGASVVGVGRRNRALLPAGIASTDSPYEIDPADVVVDCTGSPTGLALATKLTRPQGTIVLKTTVHDALPVTPTPWVIDELTVIGSRCGPFAPALRLLAAGLVDPRPLISEQTRLSPDIIARASRPGVIKVLVEPG